MIVDNPTQNAWNGAKRAWDESKWAKHLATITERIKLAQDTLDRANQTLNSINKVNDVLNKTNQFLTGSILSVPNPMQYVEKPKVLPNKFKTTLKGSKKMHKTMIYAIKLQPNASLKNALNSIGMSVRTQVLQRKTYTNFSRARGKKALTQRL